MAIAPLADVTSRLLGSTLVLNDSTSVVKELIDNALDSHASSVLVEISSNTVDVVQVKDNGSGIGVEDRQLLCRRGYTSKIRTIEDLEKLGGMYLGFRGEALASIANISESVSVTTRVEGELVGTMLKYGPQGTLQSSASASHPVGTTVRIQNFLATIPVRRQTVLKASTKILSGIKMLLFNYAFARPTVRFALKVLKGKNDKANWSYVPCSSDADLSSAASKIVGKDIAGLCEQHADQMIDTVSDAGRVYKCQALLLTPGSTAAAGSGVHGQYVSLDRRPVSIDRGTFKEVIKLYRSHLKHASSPDGSPPSSPFLCIHFECPEGTYDVNVEPSKGEVLFHRPDMIINLASSLFVQLYGSLPESSETPLNREQASRKSKTQPFQVLLARKPNVQSAIPEAHGSVTAKALFDPSPTPDNTLSSNRPEDNDIAQLSPHRKAVRNMYESFGEDQLSCVTGSVSDVDRNEPGSINNINDLNPFLMAKMNTMTRPKPYRASSTAADRVVPPASRSQLESSMTSPALISSAINNTPISSCTSELSTAAHLPTPDKTPFQNPGPPHRRKAQQGDGVVPDVHFADIKTSMEPLVDRRNRLDIRTGLPIDESRPPTFRSAKDVIAESEIGRDEDELLRQRAAQFMGPSPKQSRSRTVQNTYNKPFRPPLKDGFTSLKTGQVPRKTPHPGPNNIPQTSSNSELDEIMDFEHRKRALNSRKGGAQSTLDPKNLSQIQSNSIGAERVPFKNSIANHDTSEADHDISETDYAAKFTANNIPPSCASNPHQNRYLAAKASLSARNPKTSIHYKNPPNSSSTPAINALDIVTSTTISAISATDPRAYLIATNRAIESGQPTKRVKPSRLPLETVPPNAAIHRVLAILPYPFPLYQNLSKTTHELSTTDTYIKTGTIENILFDPFSPDLKDWQTKLENLITTQYEARPTAADGPIENIPAKLEVSLTRAIKAHQSALEPENTKII